MGMTVLLLGRKGIVLDDVRRELSVQDVTLLGGTSLDDVRTAFAERSVDVASWARASIWRLVRHIFAVSNSTTVQMEDFDSGPSGMLPFVDGILRGLRT